MFLHFLQSVPTLSVVAATASLLLPAGEDPIECGVCEGGLASPSPQQGHCFTLTYVGGGGTVTDGGCTKEEEGAECLQTKNCNWTVTMQVTPTGNGGCANAALQRRKCTAEVDADGVRQGPWACPPSWTTIPAGETFGPSNEPIACGDAKQWSYRESYGTPLSFIPLTIEGWCEPDCPASDE